MRGNSGNPAGRRLVAAVMVGMVWVAVADGGPRNETAVPAPGDLRVNSVESSVGRQDYPLRVRREALPHGTDSKAGSSAVGRRDGPEHVLRGAEGFASERVGMSRSLRHESAPEGVHIVDGPYAPETLEGMIATEEVDRGSGIAARTARHRLGVDARSHAVRNLDSAGVFERRASRGGVREEETAASADRSVEQRATAEQERRWSLRHEAVSGDVAVARTRGDVGETREFGGVTDDVSARRMGAERTALRHEADFYTQRLGGTGAVYRAERMAATAGAGEAVTPGVVPSLTASARINQSIGTANTFVVLSVENTGTETVSSPVVRLMLPEKVEYGGIAFAPPGTGVAVVETKQGRAVDVVLPLRVASGHSSRAMVYLTPGAELRNEDLRVEAFAQGEEKTSIVTEGVAAGVESATGESATTGTSKDP